MFIDMVRMCCDYAQGLRHNHNTYVPYDNQAVSCLDTLSWMLPFPSTYQSASVIILYNNWCLSDTLPLTESVHRRITSVSCRLLEKKTPKVI